MGAYLFLDTNIYLHFKQFDQINWKEIVRTDDITIVIPSIIISELDKHKNDSNKRIAKQSRAIIKLISDYNEISSPPRLIKINILTKEPNPSTFKKYKLDKEISDDRIIANIIEFKKHQNSTVILISNDLGISLKAKSHNIDVLRPNEDLQLQIANDTMSKRIMELEKEIIALKSRIPKLRIQFSNNKFFTKHHVKHKAESINIKKRINELKDEYPYKKLEEVKKEISIDSLFISLFDTVNIRQQNIDWYNKDLDNYFIDYEKYLYKYNEYITLYSKSYKIDLILKNEGTTPAEDIYIKIHIPDGMSVLNKDEFPDEPKRPPIPVLKKGFELFTKNYNILGGMNLPMLNSNNLRIPNVSNFKIKKTNSYDLSAHVTKLMHHTETNLDSFYITFSDNTVALSFDFEYQIIAGNVPDKMTGKLKFILEK